MKRRKVCCQRCTGILLFFAEKPKIPAELPNNANVSNSFNLMDTAIGAPKAALRVQSYPESSYSFQWVICLSWSQKRPIFCKHLRTLWSFMIKVHCCIYFIIRCLHADSSSEFPNRMWSSLTIIFGFKAWKNYRFSIEVLKSRLLRHFLVCRICFCAVRRILLMASILDDIFSDLLNVSIFQRPGTKNEYNRKQ